MKKLEWSVQITSSDLWLVTAREGERKRNTINERKKKATEHGGESEKQKRGNDRGNTNRRKRK